MYFKIHFIPVMQSWIFSNSRLQCHMTLQKSFQYAVLLFRKHFFLLLMLKTAVQTENKIILLTPLEDYFAWFKQKLT